MTLWNSIKDSLIGKLNPDKAGADRLLAPASPSPSRESEAISTAQVERIKLLLGSHMEEYKSLRTEYGIHLAYQHQILQLTFLVIGALIAGASPLLQAASGVKDTPARPEVLYVFLAAALVFQAVAWAQLRYLESNVAIRNYIVEFLSLRVEQLINQLPRIPSSNNVETPQVLDSVFNWEDRGMKGTYPSGKKMMLPIMAARLFLSTGAGVISLISFVWSSYNTNTLSLLNVSLSLVVFLIIVYTLCATAMVFRDVTRVPLRSET